MLGSATPSVPKQLQLLPRCQQQSYALARRSGGLTFTFPAGTAWANLLFLQMMVLAAVSPGSVVRPCGVSGRRRGEVTERRRCSRGEEGGLRMGICCQKKPEKEPETALCGARGQASTESSGSSHA